MPGSKAESQLTAGDLISETEFLNTTMQIMRTAGYGIVMHIVDREEHAKVTETGWPDVFGAHVRDGIVAAELKSETGEATDDQLRVLRLLARTLPPPNNPYAESRAHLWFPRDADARDTQLGVTASPTRCVCIICEELREERSRANPVVSGGNERDNRSSAE